MSESFPVDERRTFDEQIGLLTNPLFEILVWKDGDLGDVKGFISTYRLEGFCFVEHFAVSEKYRNEGIGRSVLKNCSKGRKKFVWRSSLRKRNRQGAGSNFIAETVSIRTNIRIYSRLFPRVRNPFRL